MVKEKLPARVGDGARPESDLSQVLAHGPAISMAYGKLWGGVIILAAVIKANRGPISYAAAGLILLGAKMWRG